MPNTSAIRSGRAFVEIFADDSALVRGLNQISTKLKKWGASITATGMKIMAAGTAATTPFIAAAKLFSDTGDQLQKMSQRTGIAVETLSELAFAANASGTSIADVETGLRAMQRNITNASNETKTTLERLGISIAQLRNQSPEQQFKTLADAIARINDPTEKAALAMQLFGKSGTALLPLFADGAAGIEALQQQARDLGLTMTTEDANAAAALNDAIGAMTATLTRTATAIGAAVAPALTSLANWLAQAIAPVIAFINANRDLILTILKIAAVVAAAGAALVIMGQLIAAAGAAFGAMATILTTIGSVLGTLAGLVAAILTPAGALLAIFAAAGAYAAYVSKAWQPVLTWLADAFNWVSEIAIKAWNGISDAIAAGDLQLAAEIALEGLKILWYEAIAWIQKKWLDLKTALVTIWYNTIYGIAQLALTGIAGIQNLWVNLQATFRRLWVKTIKALGDAWDALYYWLAKAFTNLTNLFSSAAEKAAAKQALDEEQAARAKEREAKARAALAEIDRDAEEKRQSIDSSLMDTLATLDEDRRRAIEDATSANADNIDELRKKAQQAREKFDELTKKAADAAAGKAGPAAPAAPAPEAAAPDIAAITAKTEKATTVMGTFSALAAGRLGPSNPLERTARATEETAKNTKRLLQKPQPTFS